MKFLSIPIAVVALLSICSVQTMAQPCQVTSPSSLPAVDLFGLQYPPTMTGLTVVGPQASFATQAVLSQGSFGGSVPGGSLPSHAIGSPDTVPDPGCVESGVYPAGLVSTGHAGFVELTFGGAVQLTNSGDSRADLHIFEGGAHADDGYVALRAAPGQVVTQAVLDELAPTSFVGTLGGASFHVIGKLSDLRGLGGSFWSRIDLDGPSSPLRGYPAGLLRFDAVMLLDDPDECPPGSSCSGVLGIPGSGSTNEPRAGMEIDAVAIFEAATVAPSPIAALSVANPILPRSDFYLCQTEVTLRGTDLLPPVSVSVGGVSLGSVTYVGPGEVRATIQAGAPGPGLHDVVLTCANGVLTVPAAYTRTSLPTIDPQLGLAPGSGPTTGGNQLTITGTGLIDVIGVDVGSNPATNVSWAADGTSVTCTVPASPASGLAPVLVRMRCQSAMAPGAYEYVQSVELSGTVFIAANDATYDGTHLVLRDRSQVTIDGSHVFESLTLVGTASLTHSPAGSGAAGPGMDLSVLRDLTIEPSAEINVNARGHAPGAGPGVSARAFGSSHGGEGGLTAAALMMGPPPAAYGDPLQPVDFGSGGAVDVVSTGGDGGGAVRIVVGGTATLSGRVTANASGRRASGGSIWIEAERIVGRPQAITANGATWANSGRSDGGAGGRIALVSRAGFRDFQSIPQAHGNGQGAPGTIVRRTSNALETEVVIRNTQASDHARTVVPSIPRLARLEAVATGGVDLPGTAIIDDLEYSSGELSRVGDLEVGSLSSLTLLASYPRLVVDGNLLVRGPVDWSNRSMLEITGDAEFLGANRLPVGSGVNVSPRWRIDGRALFRDDFEVEAQSSAAELAVDVLGDLVVEGDLRVTAISSNATRLRVAGPVRVDGNLEVAYGTTGRGFEIGGPLRVLGNASLTDRGRIEPLVDQALEIEVGGTLHVGATAIIQADGIRQTRDGTYPGDGYSSTSYGTGGSHGGDGGFYAVAFPGGSPPAFGSIDRPLTLGGAGGLASGAGTGFGFGGGSLHLRVAGALELEGTISANGTGGSTNGSGAGAGGSILVEAARLIGNGYLRANGGGSGSIRSDGGGGRIAVHCTTPIDRNTIGLEAFGGYVSSYFGGAGTIWLDDASSDAPVLGFGWFGANPRISSPNVVRGRTTADASVLAALPSSPRRLVLQRGTRVVWSHATVPPGAPVVVAVSGDCDLATDAWMTVQQGYPLHLQVGGDLTVAPGGAVHADARGHAPDEGPGSGVIIGPSGGGAGHGGFGSAGFLTAGFVGVGGTTHGNPLAPTDLGSGGASVGATSGTTRGGFGGGALRIDVTGNCMIEGRITSDGERAFGNPTAGCGGGAGGSVWLTADRIIGAGTLRAIGGRYTSYEAAGAGGRIALEWLASSGGLMIPRNRIDVSGGQFAGCGTLFLRGPEMPLGELVVAGGVQPGLTPLPTARLGALTIDGSAKAIATGPLTVDGHVSIQGSSELQSDSLQRLELSVGGDLNIGANAAIQVRGRGWPADVGPGAGAAIPWNGTGGSSQATGAGHGAFGGGMSAGQPGGGTYGNDLVPDTFGSGGGTPYRAAFGSATRAVGGSGGGSVFLDVAETVTIDGRIDARGLDGFSASGSGLTEYSGGGSGGSVLVRARTVAGLGIIDVRGGLSPLANGRGGGGRVAIYASRCGMNSGPTAFLDGGSLVWQGGCSVVPTPATSILSVLQTQRTLGVSDAVVTMPAGTYQGFDLGSLFVGGAWPELRTITLEGDPAGGTMIDVAAGQALRLDGLPAGVTVVLRDLDLLGAGSGETAMSVVQSDGLVLLERCQVAATDGSALVVDGGAGAVWLTETTLVSGPFGLGLSSLSGRLSLQRSSSDRTSADPTSRVHLLQGSLGGLSGAPQVLSNAPFAPVLDGPTRVATSLTGGEALVVSAGLPGLPVAVATGYGRSWLELPGLVGPLVVDLFDPFTQVLPVQTADVNGQVTVPLIGSGVTPVQLLGFLGGDSLVAQAAVVFGPDLFLSNPHLVRIDN